MWCRFHRIPQRNGRTDRQTDRSAISISRVSVNCLCHCVPLCWYTVPPDQHDISEVAKWRQEKTGLVEKTTCRENLCRQWLSGWGQRGQLPFFHLSVLTFSLPTTHVEKLDSAAKAPSLQWGLWVVPAQIDFAAFSALKFDRRCHKIWLVQTS